MLPSPHCPREPSGAPSGGVRAPWSSASSTPSASCPATARPTGRRPSTTGSWTRWPSSGRRRRRDQVRLGVRAPLPRPTTRTCRTPSRSSAFCRGQDLQHPPGLGHLQHHAAGQPPGPHRRAGGHARPPERGPVRVRHRPRLVDHRAARLRHRGPRDHPGDGRRDPARDHRACGSDDRVLPRRTVLLDARAQRAAQALHPAPPAAVDGGWQPRDLRAGGQARGRGPLLRLHPAPGPDPAHRQVQGEDRRVHRPGRGLRQQQRHDHDPDALHGGRGPGPAGLLRRRLQLPPEPGLPVPRHLPQAQGHPRLARDHPRRRPRAGRDDDHERVGGHWRP